MKENTPAFVLLSLLSFLPFVVPYHAYPLTTFHAELLTLMLAVVLIAVTLIHRRTIVYSHVVTLLLLFDAYIYVRSLTLTYYEPSLIMGVYVVLAAYVYLATLQVIYARASDCRRIVLLSLAFGGFVMALTGFAEHFGLGFIRAYSTSTERVGMMGALGQPSIFAAYIACGMAALLGSRLDAKLTAGALAIMAAALAYSGARVAWVFVLLLLIVALSNKALRRLWLLAFVVFVAVRLSPDAVSRAPSGVTSIEHATHARWEYLKVAWRIWLDYPLFGVGVGELGYQMYTHLLPTDRVQGFERHTHNIVAQLLVETGIIGLVLIVAALWVRVREMPRTTRVELDHAATLAVLAIIGVFSFTEFPLWHAQFLMIGAIMLGLLPRALRINWPRVNWELQRRAVSAMCVALFVMLCVVAVQYRDFERFYVGEATDIRIDGSLFRPQLETLSAAGMKLSPETARRDLALIERAMHAFPKAELLCRYVEFHYALGDTQRADQALVKLLQAYQHPDCLITQ